MADKPKPETTETPEHRDVLLAIRPDMSFGEFIAMITIQLAAHDEDRVEFTIHGLENGKPCMLAFQIDKVDLN